MQLASQVPGLSDEHYLGYFTKGLDDSVRSALRLLCPRDLETAMELAKDVEDNLTLQLGGRASSRIFSAPIRTNSYPRLVFGTNSGSGTTPGNRGGSTASYRAKQTPFAASGQNANECTSGHECSLKQLRVLLAEEDELLDFSQAELLEIVESVEPGDPNKEPEGGEGSLPVSHGWNFQPAHYAVSGSNTWTHNNGVD